MANSRASGVRNRRAVASREAASLEVARKLSELRTESASRNARLAKLVGTSPSAICRLEDADCVSDEMVVEVVRRVDGHVAA